MPTLPKGLICRLCDKRFAARRLPDHLHVVHSLSKEHARLVTLAAQRIARDGWCSACCQRVGLSSQRRPLWHVTLHTRETLERTARWLEWDAAQPAYIPKSSLKGAVKRWTALSVPYDAY